MYSAKIYVKKNCPKCKMTVTQLMEHLDIETEIINHETDTIKLDAFRKQGYSSFPVVLIMKHKQRVDDWCDFRVDKIQEWGKKLS